MNHRLDDRKLRAFLNHLEECAECKEELRITHMVYTGVEQLDDERSDSMDIEASFGTAIDEARFRLFRHDIRTIACYAADAVAFWSVLLALALQIRIWIYR